MGFMMKAAANAASKIGHGSHGASERRASEAAAKIAYWARVAAERALRAFCINPENTADERCTNLAKEDQVRDEFARQLAEKDATFVAGCKNTPYTSACVARVGLPPFWQMIYDLCGWACGLIWGIGNWLASIGPFTWAVLIIGLILLCACLGAIAEDVPRGRRNRGWGPHLD